MAHSFLFSCSLLLLFLRFARAQEGSAIPIYAGTFAGSCDVELEPPSGYLPTLYMQSITIVSSNGNDFNPMQLQIGARSTSSALYKLKGAFGCANGQLSVSLLSAEPCIESGVSPAPNLCVDYLPEHCTGIFPYSTYMTTDGSYELEIAGLCGMKGSVVLQCQGSCFGNVRCSSTINQVVIQGGTYNGSAPGGVYLTENSSAVFTGDQVTILQSHNVTIDSPQVTNLTVVVEGGETVYNTNATTVNLFSGPPRTCGGWIDIHGTLTSNFSTSSTSRQMSFGSISIATGDDEATWNMPDSSHLQYIGTTSGVSYELTFCVTGAIVYNADSLGQELVLLLMNTTSGTGVSIEVGAVASSVVLFNHTNPSSAGSACAVIVTDQINTGNTFSLYLASLHTDGSSVPLIVSPGSGFSFAATPLGCQGVVYNVTFNLTISFENGTMIKGGKCITMRANSTDGAFYVDNDGVCLIEGFSCIQFSMDDQGRVSTDYTGFCSAANDSCLSFTNNDGVLTPSFGGVCGITVPGGALEKRKKPDHSQERFLEHLLHQIQGKSEKEILETAYSEIIQALTNQTLHGDIQFVDGTNILVRHIGSNMIQWTLDPQEPIKTTEVDTPNGEPLQIPSGTETPSISTPDATPVELPDGAHTTQNLGAEGSCNCKESVTTQGDITTNNGDITTNNGNINAPNGQISTPTIVSPNGGPVNFPGGASFQPPTPIPVSISNPSNIISITTATSGSGGISGSGSSGFPIGSSSGPCIPVKITFKGTHLEGVNPETGQTVRIKGKEGKLLGGVVHSLSHAASGATHAAASAAGAAAGASEAAVGAAVQVATDIASSVLGCVNPSSLGLPASSTGASIPAGVPGFSSIGPNPIPGDITGPVADTAFAAGPTGPYDPTTLNAAFAAILASVLTSTVPEHNPGVIPTVVLWGGGLIIPTIFVNDTYGIPQCDGVVVPRGDTFILQGNSTSPDDVELTCLNRPSEQGWAWYPTAYGPAVITDSFTSGNETLICDPKLCTMTTFPNGTKELSPITKTFAGTCTLCNLQLDQYGNVLTYSDGNVTLYNRSISNDQVIIYYTDSALIMDSNTTLVNAGQTVLNNTLVTSLNTTGDVRIGGTLNLPSAPPSTGAWQAGSYSNDGGAGSCGSLAAGTVSGNSGAYSFIFTSGPSVCSTGLIAQVHPATPCPSGERFACVTQCSSGVDESGAIGIGSTPLSPIGHESYFIVTANIHLQTSTQYSCFSICVCSP